MADRPKRSTEAVRWIGAFVVVAAIGVSLVLGHLGAFSLARRLTSDLEEQRAIGRFALRVLGLLWQTYGATVLAAFAALVTGALARIHARARLRADRRDPLDRLRRFVADHPRLAAALTALPGLLWSARLAKLTWSGADASVPWETAVATFVVPAGLALLTHVALARSGVRALLAPTLVEDDDAAEEAPAEDFTFDAVAVTPESVGAVVGLAALSVAVIAVVLKVGIGPRPPWVLGVASAYAVIAIAGAVLFQRASRVSVGLDGVFVGGSSRRRFHAYRDVDDVRTWGGDLELIARGRVVLRLQLHGKDAKRRRALFARLRQEIERAKAHREDPASTFVASANAAELMRTAGGGATYRVASLSRDKLWEMLESPAMPADARQAVGEALLANLEDGERARFRVAADRCADPTVRARLAELLDEEDSDEREADAREADAARPARLERPRPQP